MEFSPIFLAFVMSLLVSLIPLGLHIFTQEFAWYPFPYQCIPFFIVFLFLGLLFVVLDSYSPFPKNLLVLGGSSILFFICLVLVPNWRIEKPLLVREILIYNFFLSCFLSCFFCSYPMERAAIFFFVYIFRFFLPLTWIGTLLLLGRALFLYPSSSLSLLMQASLLFLYLFILKQKKKVTLILFVSVYLFSILLTLNGIFYRIMGLDWETLSMFFYFPISGMLTLFLVFHVIIGNRQLFAVWKPLLFSLLFYLVNSTFIAFMSSDTIIFLFIFISIVLFIVGLVVAKCLFHSINMEIERNMEMEAFPLSLFFIIFLGCLSGPD